MAAARNNEDMREEKGYSHHGISRILDTGIRRQRRGDLSIADNIANVPESSNSKFVGTSLVSAVRQRMSTCVVKCIDPLRIHIV